MLICQPFEILSSFFIYIFMNKSIIFYHIGSGISKQDFSTKGFNSPSRTWSQYILEFNSHFIYKIKLLPILNYLILILIGKFQLLFIFNFL